MKQLSLEYFYSDYKQTRAISISRSVIVTVDTGCDGTFKNDEKLDSSISKSIIVCESKNVMRNMSRCLITMADCKKCSDTAYCF